MKRWMLIGLIIALAGIVLVGFALLTPTVTQSGGSGTGSGQLQTHYSYAQVNLVLSIVGSVMATGGGALFIFRREEVEKLPNNLAEAPSTGIGPVTEDRSSKGPVDGARIRTGAVTSEEGPVHASESNLVLRLLEGDERAMFRALIDKGGEALQKDLIVATKMSDAKASRVLDRLVEKGVISKERHGMTNKVRVRIDQ